MLSDTQRVLVVLGRNVSKHDAPRGGLLARRWVECWEGAHNRLRSHVGGCVATVAWREAEPSRKLMGSKVDNFLKF